MAKQGLDGWAIRLNRRTVWPSRPGMRSVDDQAMSYSTLVGRRVAGDKDVRTYSAAANVKAGYAARIALSLHDSAAVPDGAGCEECSIEARILLVTRTYTQALRRWAADACPVESALLEIKRRAGAELDPEVVGELLTIIRNDALADLNRVRRDEAKEAGAA